ncbi:hypothetical protein [Flavobacterium gelatinilyticum]|uniref:hypothetical protein n=1 Tax=Flavobacterium gelatinilyticum TaxID=3003260 RepID=UPI002480A38C|nr:hypothetical protein [Flavobacterium gelatinilyticum]
MSDSNNLWPDFEDVPKIVSPRAILTEQANFLSEKTNNLLNGSISASASSTNEIITRFKIVAPLLNNYSYQLFAIIHSALYYPCDLRYNAISYKINNEEDLREKIREIFNNEETKNIIFSLLGQSKEINEQ